MKRTKLLQKKKKKTHTDYNLIGHIYFGMQSIYQKWNNWYVCTVINQMLIITVVASYFRGQILEKKNTVASMKYIHW